VLHGSFTVTREINAPLPRVWDAYSVEQYTFLAWADDGAHDQAHLRGSTRLAFNALAALVEPAPETALKTALPRSGC
jgi:uncharacterized protein YndB with AHSA1/START domain